MMLQSTLLFVRVRSRVYECGLWLTESWWQPVGFGAKREGLRLSLVTPQGRAERVTCCVLRVTSCVLHVTCYVLRVTCCVLRVTCYVLRVTV